MRIDTQNPAARAMAISGLVLILAAGVVHFLVKPPSASAAIAKLRVAEAKSFADAESNTATTRAEFATIQTRLWKDQDDVIAPSALSSITALAQSHGIKVTTFRPQKEVVAGKLSILPFFFTVDGAFPAVYDFVKDLEQNDQLQLIVNLVQIAASDQNSHNVTASIGISAYIDPTRKTVANDKGTATPTPKSSQTDAAKAAPKGTHSTGKA